MCHLSINPLVFLCKIGILLPLFVVILAPVIATAAWQVIPVRLEFDQRTRSGIITLKNDNDEPMSFSVDARQWIQNAEGKDIYIETKDILFFPKQLTIDPHQERVIRAGIKIPAIGAEKTYRLFIKQEASPQQKQTGSQVAIAIRFGVPIFVVPVSENIQGKITDVNIKNGTLNFVVNNQGNVHFRVNAIQLTGKKAEDEEIFSQDLAGAYFLAGTEKSFSMDISEDFCAKVDFIKIDVISDRIQLNERINVDEAMCFAP